MQVREGLDQPPHWARWHNRMALVDLDGNGACEAVGLWRGRLFVRTRSGALAFESPAEWLVGDLLVGDVDRDGAPEVLTLVWKRGSFGPVRPFWVEEDPAGQAFCQHIYVHRWREGTLEPVWMSSAIGVEVVAWEFDDACRLVITARDGSRSVWEWGAWGFGLVEQGPACEGRAELSLLAVGDNIIYEQICEAALVAGTNSFDFSPVYEQVAQVVGAYDLAAVCQESVLVHEPALRHGYPRFATPESAGSALVQAGFDIVCAATNHANDWGARALDDTLAFWAREWPEVTLLGVHASPEDQARVVVREAAGVHLALFDYTYGLNGCELDEGQEYRIDLLENVECLVDDLRRVYEQNLADASVCFVHAGVEYQSAPSAEQVALAERLVDAGAAVVAFSHAHVVAPAGVVRTPAGNEGVVFWGLGNFVALQEGLATSVGCAASVVFEKTQLDGHMTTRVASFDLLPTVCHAAPGAQTQAFFLPDYPAELAHAHWQGTPEAPVTLERLWQTFLDGAAG